MPRDNGPVCRICYYPLISEDELAKRVCCVCEEKYDSSREIVAGRHKTKLKSKILDDAREK